MATEEQLQQVVQELASAKCWIRWLVIAGAVASVLVLSLVGLGKSENAALREKVAALEKTQNTMAQGFAQKVTALEKRQNAVAQGFPEEDVGTEDIAEKVATLEKALNAQGQQIAQVLSSAAQAATEATPAQEVLPEVRARSFVLVDENGKVRACLATDANGPGLELYDENGYVVAPPDTNKSENESPPPVTGPVRPRRQGRF